MSREGSEPVPADERRESLTRPGRCSSIGQIKTSCNGCRGRTWNRADGRGSGRSFAVGRSRPATVRSGRWRLAGAFALLGYALGCVAGALALATLIGAPLAFLAVGGAHVLGAGIAVGVLLRRPVSPPLGQTMAELDHTASLLSADARAVRRELQAPTKGQAARERIASRGVA